MTFGQVLGGGHEQPVVSFDGTVRVCQFSIDPSPGIEPQPQSKQRESVGPIPFESFETSKMSV